MRKARIGVVCLTRKTYDYETAFSLYLSRCEEMEKDTSVQWKIYKENVIGPWMYLLIDMEDRNKKRKLALKKMKQLGYHKKK